MRVILNTTTTSYSLAGEYGTPERIFSGVMDFKISAEVLEQPKTLLRASSAGQKNRDNLTTTVAFTTRRVFGTHAEAFRWCADHEAAFPREGTLMFATGSGSRHLEAAHVPPPTHAIHGCEAVLNYTATGTSMVQLTPATVIEAKDIIMGLLYRQVNDGVSEFEEVGFLSPVNTLGGDARNGWTDPGGNLLFRIERSLDLETWDYELLECPSSPEADGTDYIYWARAKVPLYWEETLDDFVTTSDRYGKSITAINLLGADISLPHFPYAMPSQAASLQTDLRAAGYTGATVTSISAGLNAIIRNHTVDGIKRLVVTMSGSNVTGVSAAGTPISLPGYPYAMPSQAATLQAALRTAGQTGAVVNLHADSWTVLIPNVAATGSTRQVYLTITPGNPYPAWDFFGNYTGEAPATVVSGIVENVRNPAGEPLQEALKQFFRLGISPGPNHRY